MQRLTDRLHLPSDDRMQDWPLEVADPARLEEFVRHYAERDLEGDDRFALMKLIVASFDDADDASKEEAWPAIRDILRVDADLHAYTIYYWSCWDAEEVDDPDQQFRASPYLREISI